MKKCLLFLLTAALLLAASSLAVYADDEVIDFTNVTEYENEGSEEDLIPLSEVEVVELTYDPWFVKLAGYRSNEILAYVYCFPDVFTIEQNLELLELHFEEYTKEEILKVLKELLAYDEANADEILDFINKHLGLFYTDEEIRQTTLIVQAENGGANSDTIWSAHVWVVLNRVGTKGFAQNDSIIGILSAKKQFYTYKKSNLEKTADPRVEKIVRDVFSRKILEDIGGTPKQVGRTVPSNCYFFKASGGKYNAFYLKCWANRVNPFDSAYNPYSN